jgi:hypothetical protein
MKNYTVIYSETFQVGSHQNQIIKFKHITCDKDNIVEEVEKFTSFGNVHYIFDEHNIQTED